VALSWNIPVVFAEQLRHYRIYLELLIGIEYPDSEEAVIERNTKPVPTYAFRALPTFIPFKE
jgi:hypothetical protein